MFPGDADAIPEAIADASICTAVIRDSEEETLRVQKARALLAEACITISLVIRPVRVAHPGAPLHAPRCSPPVPSDIGGGSAEGPGGISGCAVLRSKQKMSTKKWGLVVPVCLKKKRLGKV